MRVQKNILSKKAVKEYSADLFELDATISLQRTKLFADILNSLDTKQKQFLDVMVKGGFSSWESLGDQIDKRSMSHDEHVLVMTYASEMFGWYAGSVEADIYFAPERHGNYFGAFYIKDAPAMGKAGYTIDEAATSNSGEAFLNVLNTSQKTKIRKIVIRQKDALNSIVEKRKAISTELRKALNKKEINEEKVISFAREYGEYDGEISYYYATVFTEVGKTLTTKQKTKLLKIRDLDEYPCEDDKIYLYSEKRDRPTIENNNFLFK